MQGKFLKRHLCSELVSIARVSDSKGTQAMTGNLEEIGERSALILTSEAVAPGTKVRVTGEQNELRGSVRSCVFDQILGFFVDIMLDVETRWSEKWFRPQHLLRLCPALGPFTENSYKVPEKLLLALSATHEVPAMTTAKGKRRFSAPRGLQSDASKAARQRPFPNCPW
jgi:hypothetical protein